MQCYIRQHDESKKKEYAEHNIEGLIVDIEQELLNTIATDPLPGNLQLSFYVRQLLSPQLRNFSLSGNYTLSEKEFLESPNVAPARDNILRAQQLQKFKWIRNTARHRYSINPKVLQSVQGETNESFFKFLSTIFPTLPSELFRLSYIFKSETLPNFKQFSADKNLIEAGGGSLFHYNDFMRRRSYTIDNLITIRSKLTSKLAAMRQTGNITTLNSKIYATVVTPPPSKSSVSTSSYEAFVDSDSETESYTQRKNALPFYKK